MFLGLSVLTFSAVYESFRRRSNLNIEKVTVVVNNEVHYNLFAGANHIFAGVDVTDDY